MIRVRPLPKLHLRYDLRLRGFSPASCAAGRRDGLGLQHIHALSHDISGWADEPFVNNAVEAVANTDAPQYG